MPLFIINVIIITCLMFCFIFFREKFPVKLFLKDIIYLSFCQMFLVDKGSVPEAEETVSLLYSLLVCIEDILTAGESRDQHDQS